MGQNELQVVSVAPDKIPQTKSGIVLPFPTDRRAFERQPDESVQAYEAWDLYKDYKFSGQGGIAEVSKTLKKSIALIGRWSQRWLWKERFRLYQNHKHIEDEAMRRKEMQARNRKWAERSLEIRDRGFDVGKKLIERGESLLALPTYKREVRETVRVADQDIPTVTYLIFNEHPKDGRGYIETGIKLQRLSADMTTENVSIASEDLDRDLDNMTPEELLDYANELERIRQQEREAGKA